LVAEIIACAAIHAGSDGKLHAADSDAGVQRQTGGITGNQDTVTIKF